MKGMGSLQWVGGISSARNVRECTEDVRRKITLSVFALLASLFALTVLVSPNPIDGALHAGCVFSAAIGVGKVKLKRKI